MKNKRLLFVIPDLSSGGAEKILSTLLNSLTSEYAELALLTLRTDKEDFYPLDGRIMRHKLSVLGQKGGRFSKALRFFSRFREIRRKIEEIDPDLVVSFMDFTNIYVLASLGGLSYPVIISERTYPPNKPLGFFWESMRRLLYPRATKLVSLSRGVSDCFPWLPEEKRAVIYNFFIPRNSGEAASFPYRPGDHYIAAMGRLVPLKGHALMIRAFAQLVSDYPDWRLVIFGNGKERAKLEALIAELGLREMVSLPGNVLNSDAELAGADIFLHASFYEGFGNVLVEAMDAGLAVVSTDCMAGPREIVEHERNGLLVETGSIDGIRDGLARLMSSRQLRDELRSNALESIQRFSFPGVQSQWIDLFEECSRP